MSYINFFILIGFICAYFFYDKSMPVRYVRSADLIYNFQGMKEAQKKQERKTVALKSNVDTLQIQFQKAVNQYNQDFPHLSKEERTQRENLLALQRENYRKYTQQINESIQEQDQKLTEGVLNQVNVFVEDYAKKKGYDLVLGTTASGNILFAKNYMDITNEVLEALNKDYSSTPSETKWL